MNPTKLEIAETILGELTDAAYTLLCESNGVSDNEWRVEDGVAVPRWPVDSFYAALKRLSDAHTKADEYFNPVDAEKRRKWSEACSIASDIIKEFEADTSRQRQSWLHRNIADAIYGVFNDAPPPAVDRRSGANGMKEGDRVIYDIDGRHGVAGEFLQDGDCYVTFDDGAGENVKWNNLTPKNP